MKLPYSPAKAPKLILTPFLDMFTTLLAFLLLSFAPKETHVRKSASILLPDARAKISQHMPRLQVEVADSYVRVNGKILEGVNPSTATAAQWEPLKARLEQLKSSQENEPILIMADKRAQFQLVDRLSAYLAATGHASLYFLTKTVGANP